MRNTLLVIVGLCLCSLGLVTSGTLGAKEQGMFTMKSPVFTHEGKIPSKYTCEGDDISPPLHWDSVPDQARSLVLIVDDPDAPDPRAPRMTWVHWVVYNIPADTHEFAEGVRSQELPSGTIEGLNDWKRAGYGGPCPPIGRHRYFFKLYALDATLPVMRQPSKAAVEAAMKDHILASAVLIGTYEKSR